MTNKPLLDELQPIIEALTNYPEREITGAKLGELIRDTAKSLNIREVVAIPFGTGALSKFIQLYLSNYITKTGKSGGDVVYTIIREGMPISSIFSSSQKNLWSVFINPIEQACIYLNRSELTLQIQETADTSLSPELVKFEKLTHAELQSIQAEFTNLIAMGREDQPLINELKTARDNIEWFNILKNKSFADCKNWQIYRRQQIAKLFAARLNKLELDEAGIQKLVAQLNQAQYKTVEARRKTKAEKVVSFQGQPSNSSDQSDEQLFRQWLIAAITEMPIEDLRQLSLPYGAVFNSLMKLRLKPQ